MTTFGLCLLALLPLLLMLGTAELVTAFFMAPEGFEDRHGFHFRFVAAA